MNTDNELKELVKEKYGQIAGKSKTLPLAVAPPRVVVMTCIT